MKGTFEMANNHPKWWIVSQGYDGLSGFYWKSDVGIAAIGQEVFVEFPEAVTKILRKDFERSRSFWKRLKYLLKPTS